MTPERKNHFSIVTETFPPEINGVANTLGYLTEGLNERGHRVDVVRPRQKGESRRSFSLSSDQLITAGLPLPGYPDLRFGLPATQRLRKHWRRQRPDAIYVATQGPLGWSAISAARSLNIPVTTGFHTNFHQYSQFYRAGFLERLIRRYLRGFHNRSDKTLAPTRKVQRSLKDWGIRHVECWSRGVDCSRFSPSLRSQELRERWGLRETDLAILYVGRLAAEKNLAQVIATFERVQSIHKNARLILVGDGPLRQQLQARHPDCVFCGTRTGDDLAEHYASGDIFLFPSRSDTFGNVVTEALASGLAVVAFDDAAAAEHIETGMNGMTVPLHDDEGFTRATLRLADQPSLMGRIRQQARARALALDWQSVVDAFETQMLSIQSEVTRYDTKQSIQAL